MTLILDFQGQILTATLLEWEGRLAWNEIDVSWIQCWMHNGLAQWATLHGKYIGQVMGQCKTVTVSNLLAHESGCPFTDLGAEGCCRSLNTVFNMSPMPPLINRISSKLRRYVIADVSPWKASFFCMS